MTNGNQEEFENYRRRQLGISSIYKKIKEVLLNIDRDKRRYNYIHKGLYDDKLESHNVEEKSSARRVQPLCTAKLSVVKV